MTSWTYWHCGYPHRKDSEYVLPVTEQDLTTLSDHSLEALKQIAAREGKPRWEEFIEQEQVRRKS